MVEDIKFEVVTPDKLVVNELVKSVVAPGVLGEFGILSGHTPFLTNLNTGSIRFVDIKGREKSIFISGGFAEALPNKVTILADSAERRKDINLKRAKNSMKRAKERLSHMDEFSSDDNHSEKIDFDRAIISLNRAVQRIKLVENE